MSDKKTPPVPQRGQELALDMIRGVRDGIVETNRVLDNRAALLATLTSAIAGGTSAATLLHSEATEATLPVFGICLTAVWALLITAKVLKPIRREQPIGNDLPQTYELIVNRRPRDAVDQAIAQYTRSIDSEQVANARKSRLLRQLLTVVQIQAGLLALSVAWPCLCQMFHDAAP